MQLSRLDRSIVQHLGKDILNRYRQQCSSFEEAAQQLVEDFFGLFQTEDEEPEFALMRVFRTMQFSELTPELQAITKTQSGQFLTLMGTFGLEDAWCDRRQSRTRKAIPINENMSPMFKGVFHELGFSWEDSTGDKEVIGEALGAMGMVRFFHVENVSSSTFITDQVQFVQPYGIRSAIAAGSQFVSGAAYVVIGFTRVTLTRLQAETLAQLMPHISTLLAIFDTRGTLWAE